jgi:hypothetical protein
MPEVDLKTDSINLKFDSKNAINEYLIDLLGGLVPGALFMAGVVFALMPSLYISFASISEIKKCLSVNDILMISIELLKNASGSLWLIIFFVVTLFAYTVGHLFYRHDPKAPDKKSFVKIARKLQIINNEVELKRALACVSEEKCEYPYQYYAEYLHKRGLGYLTPLILWRDTSDYRSKAYINILKIRLKYFFPDKCAAIIRNEAHIRLASSTWYVSRVLTWLGLIGVVISLCSLITLKNGMFQGDSWGRVVGWSSIALLSPIMVVMISVFITSSILDFFHYQRLREVFYVLETAYTAFGGSIKNISIPFYKED